MNPKVNYLVVGIFVLVLFFATAIFSLWLAFGYDEKHEKTYLIYMSESVAGLSKESAVKFSGVNVGSVQDIQLGLDPSDVMVKINVDKDTPITVDTRATLSVQGLTGLSYIDLSGGDRSSAPLLVKPGEAYPVIPSRPSLFLRLDASLNKLTTSFSEMANSVDYLLRDENQKSVTNILHHIDKVTKAVADHSHDVENSLHKMPEVLQSINQAADMFNDQILPNLNTSLSILTSALPSLTSLIQELAVNPSALLRGTRVNQLGPGETDA